jgi:hypothetical protein
MPTRIVTSTYRYERPSRKKKPQVITGPAVVTPKKRSVLPTDGPEPGAAPQREKKPAIVTAAKRGRQPKPEPEIDPEEEVGPSPSGTERSSR